jgi:ligand-binding SRPBCC domain-containing protein
MIEAHPTQRGVWRLRAEFWTPCPLAEVFDFFADARNLEELTPPFLSFQVLTPSPIPMHVGTTIDYQLRIHGLPIRWRSLISAWQPPFRFVDEQIRGPYSLWHHEHTFEECDGGTLIRDVVNYSVPGGWIINKLFVQRDLQAIFDYRQQQMQKRFGGQQVDVTRPRPQLAHSQETCS